MSISAEQHIKAPLITVWNIITDIDNAQRNISGIKNIEVLERPADGIVGLKWRETRTIFNKEADETMTISAAEPPYWYETTAHNHGAIYTSKLELKEVDGGTLLTMSFESKAVSFGAKLMSAISFLFSGALRKMLAKDLQDIRDAAESA